MMNFSLILHLVTGTYLLAGLTLAMTCLVTVFLVNLCLSHRRNIPGGFARIIDPSGKRGAGSSPAPWAQKT